MNLKGTNILPYRTIKMRHTTMINDILDYWNTLRGHEKIPNVLEIDSSEIKNFLDYTFILHTSNLSHPRFKLAGIEISNLLNMELHGMPAYSLFEPEYRDTFSLILNNVLENQQVTQLSLRGQLSGGRAIYGKMILLPFQNKNNHTINILGAIDLKNEFFGAPIRFSITEHRATDIQNPNVMPKAVNYNTGLQESNTEFQRSKKKTPNLHVIK